MAVPDTITRALNTLEGDQVSLADAKQDSADKVQSALAAQHASEVAGGVVDSLAAQRDSDKVALLKLIDETYK